MSVYAKFKLDVQIHDLLSAGVGNAEDMTYIAAIQSRQIGILRNQSVIAFPLTYHLCHGGKTHVMVAFVV